jgi:NAD(P)-dependent dehydrogenase (short-subunit alcohol dehydrogenase family)
MTRQLLSDEPEAAAALAQIEAIAPGKAEEVADLVLFLASDVARQITGASIVIDNGATMK